jgi:hypothetical protein
MKLNYLNILFVFFITIFFSYFFCVQLLRTIELRKEVQVYKHKCDSLQHLSDSLYSELFPNEIELNRMQIGYEILLKRNKKAAEQFGNIISEETE